MLTIRLLCMTRLSWPEPLTESMRKTRTLIGAQPRIECINVLGFEEIFWDVPVFAVWWIHTLTPDEHTLVLWTCSIHAHHKTGLVLDKVCNNTMNIHSVPQLTRCTPQDSVQHLAVRGPITGVIRVVRSKCNVWNELLVYFSSTCVVWCIETLDKRRHRDLTNSGAGRLLQNV